MTETKTEWVVQRQNLISNWRDCQGHDSPDSAQADLEEMEECYEGRFRLIKRTTITTEEIVK